jgi:hypothetical protein
MKKCNAADNKKQQAVLNKPEAVELEARCPSGRNRCGLVVLLSR